MNGTGAISARLGEAARTPGATEVDLGKLTSFGWDRFYAFRPGATREEVCRFIHAGRNACGRIVRVERAPENHVFLVFALHGQVTHLEMHALANGRFDLDFPASGHPRHNSVFRIRRSSSVPEDIIWLEPKIRPEPAREQQASSGSARGPVTVAGLLPSGSTMTAPR
jgi:hypothetical protein